MWTWSTREVALACFLTSGVTGCVAWENGNSWGYLYSKASTAQEQKPYKSEHVRLGATLPMPIQGLQKPRETPWLDCCCDRKQPLGGDDQEEDNDDGR